jgi:hypothetical protein
VGGFWLPLILPLDADGFIQASGVLVWVGKDWAAARERKGKTGFCCAQLSPFRQNIEHVAGEVDAMGLARCSAFLLLGSALGFLGASSQRRSPQPRGPKGGIVPDGEVPARRAPKLPCGVELHNGDNGLQVSAWRSWTRRRHACLCSYVGVVLVFVAMSVACLSLQLCRRRVGVHGAPWLWLLRGDVVDVAWVTSPPCRPSVLQVRHNVFNPPRASWCTASGAWTASS